MTINTRLEFDGNAPNNARLQQVLDELSSAIGNISGGAIGSPFTIVGPTDNLVLTAGSPSSIVTTGTDADIVLKLAGKGSGYLQLGPQTNGIPFWSNPFSTCVEIFQNPTTVQLPYGIDVEIFMGDIAGSHVHAASFTSGTQGVGATQDLVASSAVTAEAFSTLPVGRTIGTTVGVDGSSSVTGGGTATKALGAQFGLICADASTIVTGISVDLYPPVVQTGGAITNSIALRIQDHAQGTNNWAIKTGQGLVEFGDNVKIDDKNIVVGTATGTQIATATAQKLGFWGASPVVQQVFATGAGHTVDQLITLLQTLGLCKQS